VLDKVKRKGYNPLMMKTESKTFKVAVHQNGLYHVHHYTCSDVARTARRGEYATGTDPNECWMPISGKSAEDACLDYAKANWDDTPADLRYFKVFPCCK